MFEPEPRIPLTFSAYPYLEDLTIRTEVALLCQTPDGGNYHYSNSSIPAIIELLKTARCLKHLTLDLCFHLYCDSSILGFFGWSPLIYFLSQSSSISITINISIGRTKRQAHRATALRMILSSLGRYAQVRRMVKQGVLVITPEVPQPEVIVAENAIVEVKGKRPTQSAPLPPAKPKNSKRVAGHTPGLKWWRKLFGFSK